MLIYKTFTLKTKQGWTVLFLSSARLKRLRWPGDLPSTSTLLKDDINNSSESSVS